MRADQVAANHGGVSGEGVPTGAGTFAVGEQVFIRTVTFHAIGRITALTYVGSVPFLHLENSSFVAKSSDFTETLAKGKIDEKYVIPDGMMRINVLTITDVFSWNNPLPKK